MLCADSGNDRPSIWSLVFSWSLDYDIWGLLLLRVSLQFFLSLLYSNLNAAHRLSHIGLFNFLLKEQLLRFTAKSYMCGHCQNVKTIPLNISSSLCSTEACGTFIFQALSIYLSLCSLFFLFLLNSVWRWRQWPHFWLIYYLSVGLARCQCSLRLSSDY